MNLSDEIRKQIEKNQGLKLAVGEINNHLSILEGLVRKDIEERVDEAYQRGLEDGKAQSERGCEGCRFEEIICTACENCCNSHMNNWTAKDDEIKVGDEVIYNGVTKCVVVTPETDVRYASLFDCNGIHYSADHRECKKTGKHYDIQSILEAMKH